MADPIQSKPFFLLEERGPVIDGIRVALHPVTGKAFRASDKQIPEPLTVSGLVDTGSDCCVIRRSLIEQLEIPPVDYEELIAAHGGRERVPRYYARVILPNGVEFKTRLLGADLAGAYALLIGRDLLRKCVFVYDGPKSAFSLNFD